MSVPSFRKIRARAPLRLGLAGGGTDLPIYSDQFGGAVLNVTIDRFAFATVMARNDGRVVFEADDLGVTEEWDPSLQGQSLSLHQVVLTAMMDVAGLKEPPPMTLRTTVDAPPGSGLGSSSALVVAMVDALSECFGLQLGRYELAHLAYRIERLDLGLSGGRQDQFAAAFGGLNFIEFHDGDRVIVNPLRAARDAVCEVESSIVICFSGQSRESASIIDQQNKAMAGNKDAALESMHRLKADAVDMKLALIAGDVDGMAEILSSSWAAKKATAASVSNSRIDELLQIAGKNGALAGKVSGAGGGGFMFFLVHPENRFRLIGALNSASAMADTVKFTDQGSETWVVR